MSQETAMELARAAHAKIDAHEDLCAERYGHIHATTARLEGMMKWGGGLALSIILAMLGFLMVQYLNANDQRNHDQQVKIELLEAQLRDRSAP